MKTKDIITSKSAAKKQDQFAKNLRYLNNVLKPSDEQTSIIITQIQKINYIPFYKIPKFVMDTEVNKPFIKTNLNKFPQINSYLSPYSQKFYPIECDAAGFKKLYFRKLQNKANFLFQEYAHLYYGDNCIVNFYYNEKSKGISANLLIQKTLDTEQDKGMLYVENIIDLKQESESNFRIRIYSTMAFEGTTNSHGMEITMNGYQKHYKSSTMSVNPSDNFDDSFLTEICHCVQNAETHLRKEIEHMLLPKTRDILFKIRNPRTNQHQKQRRQMAKHFVALTKQIPNPVKVEVK